MNARQERFLKAKAALDKTIDRTSRLSSEAYNEAVSCCGAEDLDNRERFTRISANLDAALSHLKMARATAGEVDGGPQDQPIARGGGT